MTNLGTLLRSELGLFSISDHLVQAVSHHDSVLLDQAVWDALGTESWAVSRHAAFATSYRMLSSIAKNLGIDGATQILDLAAELFGAVGLGQIHFEVSSGGGGFTGQDLLFGGGFRERYGPSLTIKHRMDAFVAGYGAAAASVAFPSDWGSFEAEETSCVARGDAVCTFSLARRPDPQRSGHAVTRLDASELVTHAEEEDADVGVDREAQKAALDLLLATQSDEAGVLRLPSTEGSSNGRSRLALLPVSYRAQLVFDALHLLEKRSPALAPVFLELVREATQAAAYLEIAELMRAPAIEKLDRPATGEERAMRFAGIASALGWGVFSVTDYVPERRLVLTTQVTPEAVYYTSRHGGAPGIELPGVQGVAGAIALLAHSSGHHARVGGEGSERPSLRFEDYAELARTGPELHVEEVKSIVRGDAEGEIVVDITPRGSSARA